MESLPGQPLRVSARELMQDAELFLTLLQSLGLYHFWEPRPATPFGRRCCVIALKVEILFVTSISLC
jgi:hypothetical protein